MVSVTPSAAQQIQIAATDAGAEGMPLRIAAHFDEEAKEVQYGIGFDDPTDEDEQYLSEGITVLVSPLSSDAVADLIIDYVELSPGDFRFIFYHTDDLPKPTGGSCGGCSCGSGGCN